MILTLFFISSICGEKRMDSEIHVRPKIFPQEGETSQLQTLSLVENFGKKILNILDFFKPFYDYKLANDTETLNVLEEIFESIDPEAKISECKILNSRLKNIALFLPYYDKPLEKYLQEVKNYNTTEIDEVNNKLDKYIMPLENMWVNKSNFDESLNLIKKNNISNGLEKLGIKINGIATMFQFSKFPDITFNTFFTELLEKNYTEIYNNLKVYVDKPFSSADFSKILWELKNIFDALPNVMNNTVYVLTEALEQPIRNIVTPNFQKNCITTAQKIDSSLKEYKQFFEMLSQDNLKLTNKTDFNLIEVAGKNLTLLQVFNFLNKTGTKGLIRDYLINISSNEEFTSHLLDIFNKPKEQIDPRLTATVVRYLKPHFEALLRISAEYVRGIDFGADVKLLDSGLQKSTLDEYFMAMKLGENYETFEIIQMLNIFAQVIEYGLKSIESLLKPVSVLLDPVVNFLKPLQSIEPSDSPVAGLSEYIKPISKIHELIEGINKEINEGRSIFSYNPEWLEVGTTLTNYALQNGFNTDVGDQNTMNEALGKNEHYLGIQLMTALRGKLWNDLPGLQNIKVLFAHTHPLSKTATAHSSKNRCNESSINLGYLKCSLDVIGSSFFTNNPFKDIEKNLDPVTSKAFRETVSPGRLLTEYSDCGLPYSVGAFSTVIFPVINGDHIKVNDIQEMVKEGAYALGLDVGFVDVDDDTEDPSDNNNKDNPSNGFWKDWYTIVIVCVVVLIIAVIAAFFITRNIIKKKETEEEEAKKEQQHEKEVEEQYLSQQTSIRRRRRSSSSGGDSDSGSKSSSHSHSVSESGSATHTSSACNDHSDIL